MAIGVEYKISLEGGVDGVFTLRSGCGKPKAPAPVYPLLTITSPPPLTFTSPQPQNLSDYKIYGKTSNGASVGDPVSSGEHQGEYVIPVTVAKTGQSSTKNIYLSEPLHGATVYGIHLTPGESEYNIEYLENAVGKTPAGMNFSTGVFNYGGWENAFFMPRPCMLKYDGTVDYYLDPNDYTIKVGETPPSYTTTTVPCVQGNMFADGYGRIILNDATARCRTQNVIAIPAKTITSFEITNSDIIINEANFVNSSGTSVKTYNSTIYNNGVCYNYSDSVVYMYISFLNKNDGSAAISPSDFTFTMTTHTITTDIYNINYGGNAMMEWPKIWYKFAPGAIDGEGYFYVSDQKVDDSYHCWCNLDCNGSEIDHFYTPIYSCVYYDGKMRSICGFKQSTIAYRYFLKDYATYASANNTTSNKEWYIETFCDRQLIDALLMLIGKTTKFQTVYGKGIQESNSLHYTGDANDKGLFYGASDNSHTLKAFGMEDWWGTRYRFLAGAMTINNSTASDITLLYKLTWSNADGSEATGYQEEQYVNTNQQLTMGYKQASFAQGNDYTTTSRYFIFSNDFYRPYTPSGSGVQSLVEMGYLNFGRNKNLGYSVGGGQINDLGSIDPFTIYSQQMNETGYSPNTIYRNGNISCKPAASSPTETQTLAANADHIDYAQGKRYNMDGSQSAVTLPELSAYAGENTLSVGTTVQPSTVSITGRGIAEV